jgi:hypothetical protein
MNKPAVTEFEKLCAQNRQRADVKRLNEHLMVNETHGHGPKPDGVQNLNNSESTHEPS